MITKSAVQIWHNHPRLLQSQYISSILIKMEPEAKLINETNNLIKFWSDNDEQSHYAFTKDLQLNPLSSNKDIKFWVPWALYSISPKISPVKLNIFLEIVSHVLSSKTLLLCHEK